MKQKALTIMENDSRASEHAKAKWWRLHIAGLSIKNLSELSGYAQRTIYQMETGCDHRGKKIPTESWQRYKLCCAAIHSHLRGGKYFNWGQ